MPQEKSKNPLELLFNEYLDNTILNDPKKLAEMVRRQRRMLMAAFHPDQYNPKINPNGAFEYKDAEARFKEVNDSKEIDMLVRALELATGQTTEKYSGEAKHASEVLGYWIKDYQSRQGSNGELGQQNELLLRRVASLTEELEKSRSYASSLEERLREARRAGGFKSAGADISDKARSAINEFLSSADSFATSTDAPLSIRYDTMNGKIRKAKQAAQEHGVNFDSEFGFKVTEIVGKYINGVIANADYFKGKLDESTFTFIIDNAVKAATDFRENRNFRPQIEETVKEFIDAAIEMGKSASYSRAMYFDMAKRVGAKYGVSVNIPSR